ncbi:hypothetical protein Tco_0071662 [Tanacetum coccineum]
MHNSYISSFEILRICQIRHDGLSLELAQKAKIKWAIEGDENLKSVNKPPDYRLHIDLDFPNKLSLEQQMVLEIEVTREEIKKAVWDCGVDKSPGPDGFTFGFYRRYWTFLEDDVVYLSRCIRVRDADLFRGFTEGINMLKSKLMGISVSSDKVDQAAKKIGCAILQVPFSYLGSKVGCLMSRIQSFFGKRVSLPIYHMSLFKVPAKGFFSIWNPLDVISLMVSSITERSQYGLNGIKFWLLRKGMVLDFKLSTLLIMSSFIQDAVFGVSAYTTISFMDHIIKWITWRRRRKLVNMFEKPPSVLWLDIIKEVQHIQSRKTDLMGFNSRKMGTGKHFGYGRKWRATTLQY